MPPNPRAKTNAERQAAYRKRHLKDWRTVDSAHINMVVPAHTKSQLERLARYYDVTLREALERVLAEAEGAILAGLSSRDQKQYMDGE